MKFLVIVGFLPQVFSGGMFLCQVFKNASGVILCGLLGRVCSSSSGEKHGGSHHGRRENRGAGSGPACKSLGRGPMFSPSRS